MENGQLVVVDCIRAAAVPLNIEGGYTEKTLWAGDTCLYDGTLPSGDYRVLICGEPYIMAASALREV